MTTDPAADAAKLLPIETAPKDRYILLFGPSGYTSTPLRAEIGRWSEDRQAWVNHSHERFTDGGEPPTTWLPLPNTRPQPAPPSAREVMPNTHSSHRRDNATPPATHLAPGANAPAVEKKWDSEAGCMGTGAFVTVAAPPAGEPDFENIANEAMNDDGSLHAVFVRYFRRMYRLGLAARLKVEDAEVAALVKRLRDRLVPAEPFPYGQAPDNDCADAADLLERLAGEPADWINRAKKNEFDAHLDTQARLQAAEAKLAEREAELAKAQKLICYENMSLAEQECDDDNWEDPTTQLTDDEIDEIITTAREHHAARQQQKASAEPTSSKAGETR